MATETTQETFDLSGALAQVVDFEQELDALATLAAPRAAEALAESFELAGDRIEKALSRTAKTGQIDFENMVTAILSDLARLAVSSAVEQTISGMGGGMSSPPVSVNIAVSESRDASGIIAAQGQIASAIGQAVLSGGRWS